MDDNETKNYFYLYLSGNKFSPEANVVILIVELAGGGASDVLPIKRFDFSSCRGKILETIHRS
jgi:hypothetical protein